MLEERLRGEMNGFRDGLMRYAPVPFLDDGFPCKPAGNLFEDVSDEDSRAAKSRLPVTHF